VLCHAKALAMAQLVRSLMSATLLMPNVNGRSVELDGNELNSKHLSTNRNRITITDLAISGSLPITGSRNSKALSEGDIAMYT